MKFLEIRFPLIAIAFVIVGLVADMLPHPALGPGLIQSVISRTSEAMHPDVQMTNRGGSEAVDYAVQDWSN